MENSRIIGKFVAIKFTIRLLTNLQVTELGILRYRQVIGEDLPEIESRIQELKAELPKQPPVKRGLPERAVRAAAEMLPIQVSGMRKGVQRGLMFGMTAGGIAALAGQVGP